MQPEYLILGSGGQLGSALVKLLGERCIAVDRDQVDMSQARFTQKLDGFAKKYRFKAVFNAAAYTQVDKAEGEGKAEAFRLNADALCELAAWCNTYELPLVHVSTDYVYEGTGEKPRREDAMPAPLNAYGKSKLEGDRMVEGHAKRYLIFRTSWVYDAQGKNFFNTMLRLFHEKESLNVVSDQVGAPTYAPDLAKAMLAALTGALAAPMFPSDIYHLCGGGQTSWYGFAQAILSLARTHDSGVRCKLIQPIPSSAYPTPARRPLNSRLDCTKAQEKLGVRMPDWQESLKACIDEKYGHNGHTGLQHTGTKNHPAKTAG